MIQKFQRVFEKNHDLPLVGSFVFVVVMVAPFALASAIINGRVPNTLLAALAIVVVYLGLLTFSALWMYQAWFCRQVHNDTLTASNPSTDPAPAIIYAGVNLFVVMLILTISALTQAEASVNSVGLASAFILYFCFNFAYIAIIQERRNAVKRFITKHPETPAASMIGG